MIASFSSASLAGLHCRAAGPPADLGCQDVIVMLHGIGGSGRQLLPLAESFGPGMAPVLIDLPGHGQSPVSDDDEPRALLAAVMQAIDALGARRVWLLGHSFGGFLALMAAGARPDAFAGLVLLATTAKLRLHPELLERAASGRFDLDWVRATTGPGVSEERVRIVYEDFLRLRLIDGRRSLEKWLPLDLRPLLGTIKAPALVVRPDVDLIISPRNSTELARVLPAARLLSIPGAGHYVALARPEMLGRAVSSFIGGGAAGRLSSPRAAEAAR